MAGTKQPPKQPHQPPPAPQRSQPAPLAKGKPPTDVLGLIQYYKADFERVIPKHLNPSRMLRLAQSAIQRDRKLLACTPQSLLQAVMQASVCGLEIGVLGEAYLVPYKSVATFIPGYQGLIKLAIQSGSVTGIQSGAVFPGDEFDYGLGSEPFVRHKPALSGPREPGSLIAVYCVVRFKAGGFHVQILGKEQVDAVRARSPAAGFPGSPWNSDYEQMAVKTAIRRAMKYVPKTPEVARVLELEERADLGLPSGDLFPELPETLPGEGAKDVTPPTKSGTAETVERELSGDDDPPTEEELEAAGIHRKEPT